MVFLEHAYWFYLDELIDKMQLPNINFYTFVKFMKEQFNFLPGYSIKELVKNFEFYKHRIPVRGAILLNSKMDRVLLVTNIS